MKKTHLFAILLALFLFQLGTGFLVVNAVNQQHILTGEEAGVIYRDTVMLGERLQHNPMATSIGLQAFYWVAANYVPGDQFTFGRWWKASFMALMPPLIFLYARRRLKLSTFSCVTAAVAVGLMPHWLSNTWHCGVGLEMIVGFTALLLMDTGTPAAILTSGVLIAVTPMLYEGGFAFLPVWLLQLALYVKNAPRRRGIPLGIVTVIVTYVTLLTPKLWWTNNPKTYTGGGELVSALWPLFLRNGSALAKEVFLGGGRSYYAFTFFPGFSNPWFILAAVGGLVFAVRRWPRWWPLLLAAATSFTIDMIAGGAPGLRRAFVLVAFAGILAGGAFVEGAKEYFTKRFPGTKALALTLIVAASVLAGPALQAGILVNEYATGGIALPNDLPFPRIDSLNFADSVEDMVKYPEPVLRQIVNENPIEMTRVLGVLHVVARRRGLPSAQPYKDCMLKMWRDNEVIFRQLHPSTRLD